MIWSEDKKKKIAEERDMVYKICLEILEQGTPCEVEIPRLKYHKYQATRDLLWGCIRKAILCHGSGSMNDFRVKQTYKITWTLHYKLPT